MKQWKGGPVKIDPLALVQAIERYLVVRGTFYICILCVYVYIWDEINIKGYINYLPVHCCVCQNLASGTCVLITCFICSI